MEKKEVKRDEGLEENKKIKIKNRKDKIK